jgi:molybdopterin-containing oxidoreductase family membrane subunit
MSTTYDDVRGADPIAQAPVLAPGHTPESVTDRISEAVTTKLTKTPKWWLLGFLVGFGLLNVFLIAATKLFMTGIGVWGNNIPVGWGWDITCFVWWIGIGHAGTLISAILLLLRQSWRNSINRFAEAMTVFAVSCAGMYPILHLGRPWLPHWLLPLPGTLGAWPNFRSPLIWDVFAVSTYATISIVFWYVGMLPDLATLRDHAKAKVARFAYGMAALGWRNSSRHWANYEVASLLLAGLSTPLVLSVHSIVSFDFSIGIVPGWHTTVFPPYFVAGAVFAGFAMVLTLVLPLRPLFKLKDFITDRHLQNMAKVMLATGLIVAYGYSLEIWAAFYSGNEFEIFMVLNRFTGPYAVQYWLLIFCNILIPQLLWFRQVRSNVWALWAISMVINVGMWLERFVIIVVSLSRDFVPSSWGIYHGTKWDVMTFAGTIGLFLTLIFLFIRFLPSLNMFEMRVLTPEATKTHGEEE